MINEFRVWDMKFKRYLECDDYLGLFILTRDGEIGGDGFDETYRYIFEQYTGKKDADGKKIFEGDIAKASIYMDEDEQILEVTYFPESTAFVIDYEDADTDCVCVGCFVGSIKIIGNIHENPKLLENI